MRILVPKLLAPLLVCMALLVLAAGATAAPAVTGAFTLKSPLGGNNKLVEGPEGNIWVTLSGEENDVAKITPAGAFEEFDLGPEIQEPAGIVLAAGKLWVPTKENGILSFLPSNPKSQTLFPIPGLEKESPLGLGPDGDIWAGAKGKVFRLPPANPVAGKTPIIVSELVPKDVDAAGSLIAISDGAMEGARIVTFTTGAIPVEKDFAIKGGSQGVAGSPSGQIGFSEQVPKEKQAEEVGVINPPNLPLSVKQPDDPFGAAFGSDGAFWIVRAGGAHGLARLTQAGQLTLLGGFPAESTPRQITAGPNNTLWVTAEVNMKPGIVIRVSGLEPPVVTPPAPLPGPLPMPAPPTLKKPQTTLGKGPKGLVTSTKAKVAVKFTFSSDTTGASFQCAVTKGKKKKGKLRFASPVYRGCESPRSYRVGAGSYRFKVLAVGAGGADSTPAERSFRVVHKRK